MIVNLKSTLGKIIIFNTQIVTKGLFHKTYGVIYGFP